MDNTVVKLALCEQGFLVLKPNVFYKFEVIEGCEKCAKLASESTIMQRKYYQNAHKPNITASIESEAHDKAIILCDSTVIAFVAREDIEKSASWIFIPYDIATASPLKVTPIRKTGGSKTGTLSASYDEIVAKVGLPNATDIDDPDKVAASWGFQDAEGRKAFIWSYKVPKSSLADNQYWSTDGNKDLLNELFPLTS